ncbi:MAG: fimbria/pilus outer membrane usher protein [Symbiopectobacterium sp.]
MNEPAIESMLILGDTYISNSLFGNLSFNGIKLASDQCIWLQGLRHRVYARSARRSGTSERVVVAAIGQIIYETSILAGAFVIRDLYNTQDRGDLQVEVIEANGRISTFTNPMPSSPIQCIPITGNTKWGWVCAPFNGIGNQFAEGVIQRTVSIMC